MPEPLFYVFAAAALVCGFLVVAKRDPLISALFLIATLCNIAAIYLFFGAGFLAAVQVIVYAGAVMVLFLFIIMLLPAGTADEQGTSRFRVPAALCASVLAAELITIWISVSRAAGSYGPGHGSVEATPVTVSSIGHLLFGRFLIPLEIVSFLLLVAVVGVVMLTANGRSKRGAA